MRWSGLSDAQLMQALKEDRDALNSLMKYQEFLARFEGLPKSDLARSQLMESNVRLAEKISQEIEELQQEEGRRIAR
jgi:hypothetical protein